jgi:hypothetical protein
MKPKRILSEIEKLDPFEIPLERYHSLSNDEDWFLTQRLFALHGPWIREQLKATGAGLIIVCDRKVVYTSKDKDDLAADRVAEELERKLGKPCYIITKEPLIEEQARWSDLGGGDYYPTLALYSGRRIGTIAGSSEMGCKSSATLTPGTLNTPCSMRQSAER